MSTTEDSGPGDLDEYARRIIADWPPLTDEQRTRLAELLKPVRVGGDAA